MMKWWKQNFSNQIEQMKGPKISFYQDANNQDISLIDFYISDLHNFHHFAKRGVKGYRKRTNSNFKKYLSEP